MEKYYDLNGREKCVTAVITIGNETFSISRVVIAVRTMYSNHIKEMGDLLERLAAMKTTDPESDEAKAFAKTVQEFGIKKLELYERLIRLLLEKNGYSYDKAWWDENTDETDRRTFIEKCLMKDTDEKAKKKD